MRAACATRSRTASFCLPPLVVATGSFLGVAVVLVMSGLLSLAAVLPLTSSGSFVLECFEDVESCRAAGGEDRGCDACGDGDPGEDDELGGRRVEADAEARQSGGDEGGQEDSEREAEGGADERGDDALVPDHSPHLPSGHTDCSQHAELARAFENGKHQRVDDPE